MKRKTEIKFTKMSGAGNDFIVIPAVTAMEQKSIKTFLKKMPRNKFAIKACNRFLGIGADGLLFLEKSKNKEAPILWDFYNSDGSRPEMCANASRCVMRYLAEEGISKGKKLSIQTPFGIIRGTKNKNHVTIEMPNPKIFDLKKNILIGAENIEGGWIDSGVPHFVVWAKDVHNHKKRTDKAKMIRNHPYFEPRGTNVTFIEEIGSHELNAVSFERGVEDFTLACGTGAIAAAIFYNHAQKTQGPVKINMPGGKLSVEQKGSHIELTGPASRICDGVITQEVLDV